LTRFKPKRQRIRLLGPIHAKRLRIKWLDPIQPKQIFFRLPQCKPPTIKEVAWVGANPADNKKELLST
jgi:hypothetical protein